MWRVRGLLMVGLFCLFAAIPLDADGLQIEDLLERAKERIGKGSLSEDEIIRGLKEALEIGTSNAVEKVSKLDGYYKNPEIRIPLPEPVEKVEKFLRLAGYGSEIDAFEMSMNRAAERSAPQAKRIFWDAIKKMSFSDARKILQGRDDEATLYFRERTLPHLSEMGKPVVHKAMAEVGVTRTYQDLDAKARTIPFAGGFSFDLDQYVTDKALAGLFLMLAHEEKKIREDPAARVTDLLRKVFGGRP
jgi:hypothetical protein